MNQTRVFLIFAWLMVATLLWMEWGKWKTAQDHPATPVAAAFDSITIMYTFKDDEEGE